MRQGGTLISSHAMFPSGGAPATEGLPARGARTALVLALACALAGGAVRASAEGLGDRLRQGVASVGEGAQAVGRGIARVGENIDDSIRSSERLLSDGASPDAKRAELDAMATDALARLFEQHPESLDLFLLSAGYAVFDARKLVVLGLAAGGGRGVAVSRSDDRHVYMNMAAGGVGLSFGLGGFESLHIILFESDWHFANFLRNGFDATAEARAMAAPTSPGSACASPTERPSTC